MRLKVKLTVLVLAVIVLTSISTPVLAQEPSMVMPIVYGTVDADMSFEIVHTSTSSGTTAMTGNNGKTFWYDIDDFVFDLDMIIQLFGGNDQQQAIAASAINSMNTLMQFGETPSISDILIIDGDLAGSQLFMKLIREAELENANAYEFIPGIVTGEEISFALNMTTYEPYMPTDFPLELTNFSIPANLPVAFSGLKNPHVVDNLTFWSMLEPLESMMNELGPMAQLFGPYFSPVLMNTTDGWLQNEEFYVDLFSTLTSDIGENDTADYDILYTPGSGLEVDINFTHAPREDGIGIEQRVNLIWSEANDGWLDYVLLEIAPFEEIAAAGVLGGPLLRFEVSYSEITDSVPIGIQPGDTGTIGTG
ncbi:MAG: hypothetical protein ACTSRU_18240, partial [Candidatus Hodarchaeales archaeon]